MLRHTRFQGAHTFFNIGIADDDRAFVSVHHVFHSVLAKGSTAYVNLLFISNAREADKYGVDVALAERCCIFDVKLQYHVCEMLRDYN